MKNILLLLSAAALMFSVACKKTSQQPVVGVSAVKGTSVWNATYVNTGFKPLATKDTLFILAQNGEEHIVIALKQKGKATYQAPDLKAYYYQTLGFDVVIGIYHLNADAGNTVTITDYNQDTRTLKGSFNLSFKNSGNGNQSSANLIVFSKGEINTTLSLNYVNPVPWY